MAKTLLVGPAGAGKTTWLLNDFEQTLESLKSPLDENCFFVLPSAEHTERVLTLIVQRGVKGFFHRRVTTLPHLVTQVLGIGRRDVASHVTRFMFLRDILDQNQWEYFRAIQDRPGFLNLMLAFIDELKESLVPVSVFRAKMNALKKTEPEFSPKYEALAEIYEAYEAKLLKEGLRDEQDAFKIYLKHKSSGEFKDLRFRKIWLDGFFDFTNLQTEYIRALADMTDEMVIALTEDTARERSTLFSEIERTETSLLAMGFKKKIMAPSPKKWVRAPAVAFLERNIFRSARPAKFPEPSPSISIFEAVGLEGEIEMIVRKIRQIASEGNYRFSDFALLLRNVGSYETVIRSIFKRYGIPVAVHERERLQFSPLIGVITGLLRIFRDGWKRHDLIQFLKSSYVTRLGDFDKNYEWASELEHRALGEGVLRGREEWLRPWLGDPEDKRIAAFNEEKQMRLGVLGDLEDVFRKAAQFSRIRGALLTAVEKTFGIFKIQNALTETASRDGAGYRRFEALLDEIEASFESDRAKGLTYEAFADRFFHLVELDLYSLHEHDRNRVQVYDVSLARQKDYRVVFLAGLVEKGFPIQIREDPVLSDWERELFNGGKSRTYLKQRLPRQNMEKYLFYLALTRAEEHLILSYPHLNLEGEQTLPSYYLEEVKRLFGNTIYTKQQNLSHPYPEIGEASNMRELEVSVMGDLWNPQKGMHAPEPLLLYLTNELMRHGETRAKIARAFCEVRAELRDPNIKAALCSTSGRTSATALEEYAGCPYKYFANRVLGLRDAEENQNVFLKGRIRHKILERFFKEWTARSQKEVSPHEIRDYVTSGLEALLQKEPLICEKKYQIDLQRREMEEELEIFILREVDRLIHSPLKPKHFEYPFGTKGSREPAFEIIDEDRTIALAGVIDRIDVDEAGNFGLIVDYKSSLNYHKDKFDMGVYLQLPLYLLVMEERLKLKPVGGEFYSINDLKRRGFHHAENMQDSSYATKSNFVLNAGEFQALLEKARNYARKFIRQIRNAEIPVKPRECYDFCPYPAVCRIEKWRLPLIRDEIIKEEEIAMAPKKTTAAAKKKKGKHEKIGI